MTDLGSYATLRVHFADGVARATIDHPPINLLDGELLRDIAMHIAAADPRFVGPTSR